MHACPSIVMNTSALAAAPGKPVQEKDGEVLHDLTCKAELRFLGFGAGLPAWAPGAPPIRCPSVALIRLQISGVPVMRNRDWNGDGFTVARVGLASFVAQAGVSYRPEYGASPDFPRCLGAVAQSHSQAPANRACPASFRGGPHRKPHHGNSVSTICHHNCTTGLHFPVLGLAY
jgi:hypothetical protein